jgi:DNA-binding CsgD family transcriptional regulator
MTSVNSNVLTAEEQLESPMLAGDFDELDDFSSCDKNGRLDWVIRMLAQKKDELHRYKARLEQANRELVNTNHALSVLASRIDQNRQRSMEKFAVVIASQILPALDEIQHCKTPEGLRHQIDVVKVILKRLLPDSENDSGSIPVLSKQELRVAIMIRNGLKTSDIARLLFLSDFTVKTHRRNIRKKLGIRQGANLSSALKLKLGESHNCSD